MELSGVNASREGPDPNEIQGEEQREENEVDLEEAGHGRIYFFIAAQ